MPAVPTIGFVSAAILVIEDDPTLGGGLQAALTAQDYEVRWAATGAAAIELADDLSLLYDLVLLDLGLPDMDGIEVCRHLRRRQPDVTIVMLTARSDEIDAVLGLDAGADDYVTKPFRLAELLARIRAHLRRATQPVDAQRVTVGALEVDFGARRAHLEGRELELRPKEFDLLAALVQQPGQALSRDRIMADVWDEHWFGSTKTLDVHVSSLRRKLGPWGAKITTLRHVGYRLDP